LNGKIFDKVLRMAERGHLDKWPIVRDSITSAAFFDFPARAHEVLDKVYSEAQMELVDNFFLPFPIVAVEDTASCVLLIDLQKDQKGLKDSRGFITITHTGTGLDEFNTAEVAKTTGGKTAHRQDAIKQLGKNIIQIATGIFKVPVCNALSHIIEGHLEEIIIHNEDNELTDSMKARGMDEEEWGQYHDHLVNDAMVTCEILLHFNKPKNWIIERSPAKQQRLGKGRLPRVHQGPVYIMCTQEELHTRLGLKGEGSGKAAHARRRHFRTLKSERYGERQGETIIIPASWVGPSEIQQGKRTYKVMLDI